MKQVFQDLRSGETRLEDVPVPAPPPGHLLVRTQASLISAGTERMLADFGRGGYLDKARQQPEKVREVIDKARTDGIMPTVEAVQHKLNEPLPMGYANAGRVAEVGPGVSDFEPGDLVASNGPHAEWIVVPTTLAARADASAVAPEHAAFATVGAVALQSVRLAKPTIGERFVVSGLGLVGLLVVQSLRASGCKVLGMDFDPERLALAAAFGAETADLRDDDPLEVARSFSNGRGVDGVIVAAATSSNEPITQAARMCRKRGRIVLVGVTGLELNRADFYEKELSFQVSCSYGPGRYDTTYEDRAQDYPFGFVRWTAARNQQAVLDLLASGDLDVSPLISHQFPIFEARKAYELLTGGEPSLGIVLQYPDADEAPERAIELRPRRSEPSAPGMAGHPQLGFIGAGNFTRRILLPALAELDVELAVVASRSGTTAAMAGKQAEFRRATTAVEDVIDAPDVDAVFITTRHDSHADLARRALAAGKHVFVEKPLAIRGEELDQLVETVEGLGPDAPLLMVGFNRRFAPQVTAIRHAVGTGPLAVQMTVNAGSVPPDSWLHDPTVGGGRIVGEVCHFIDLARYLAGSPITDVQSAPLEGSGHGDTVAVNLSFENGSIASISYLANGHPRVPKERLEVFSRGRVARLINFRRLTGHGFDGLAPARLLRQDKGHTSALKAFVTAVRRGGQSPIPFGELVEVSRATLAAASGAPATDE